MYKCMDITCTVHNNNDVVMYSVLYSHKRQQDVHTGRAFHTDDVLLLICEQLQRTNLCVVLRIHSCLKSCDANIPTLVPYLSFGVCS